MTKVMKGNERGDEIMIPGNFLEDNSFMLPAKESSMTANDYDELKIRFTYHPPSGNQPFRYVLLRKMAMDFAEAVYGECPDSRERSLAITKIEEAVFWANASIARRELK
jgi:hypothetical protein